MKSIAAAGVVLALCLANAAFAQQTQYPTVGAFLATWPQELTIFQKALTAANLTLQLSNFNGTVFMPTNEAFTTALELMNVTETELLSHPEALTALLLYHVSLKVVPDLNAAPTVQVILLNKTLNVSNMNSSTFLMGDYNMAKVLTPVYVGQNNVPTTALYTIDAVLVPDVPDTSSAPNTTSSPSPARAADFTLNTSSSTSSAASPSPAAAAPSSRSASSISTPASILLLLAALLAALL